MIINGNVTNGAETNLYLSMYELHLHSGKISVEKYPLVNVYEDEKNRTVYEIQDVKAFNAVTKICPDFVGTPRFDSFYNTVKLNMVEEKDDADADKKAHDMITKCVKEDVAAHYNNICNSALNSLGEFFSNLDKDNIERD